MIEILYTKMVDKYRVREYVEEKIGSKYLVPLLGVYNKASDIDLDKLPKEFVLKCTHDSGSVVICKDKYKLDIQSTIKRLDKCLSKNLYYTSREWPYKDVKPRIVCEKMLDSEIIDYKIFCFNGKPKFLYVGQGLTQDKSLKIDFYDTEWNKMDISRSDYSRFDGLVEKPKKFDEMLDIARKLSEDMTFCRVDLYEVDEKIYFAELTLTPGAGFIAFEKDEYDIRIGNMLELNLAN